MVELPESFKISIWPMSNEIHHFKGRKKIKSNKELKQFFFVKDLIGSRA